MLKTIIIKGKVVGVKCRWAVFKAVVKSTVYRMRTFELNCVLMCSVLNLRHYYSLTCLLWGRRDALFLVNIIDDKLISWLSTGVFHHIGFGGFF